MLALPVTTLGRADALAAAARAVAVAREHQVVEIVTLLRAVRGVRTHRRCSLVVLNR